MACTPLAPTQCVLGAADEVVRVFDLRMAGKPLDELRRGQLVRAPGRGAGWSGTWVDEGQALRLNYPV